MTEKKRQDPPDLIDRLNDVAAWLDNEAQATEDIHYHHNAEDVRELIQTNEELCSKTAPTDNARLLLGEVWRVTDAFRDWSRTYERRTELFGRVYSFFKVSIGVVLGLGGAAAGAYFRVLGL